MNKNNSELQIGAVAREIRQHGYRVHVRVDPDKVEAWAMRVVNSRGHTQAFNQLLVLTETQETNGSLIKKLQKALYTLNSSSSCFHLLDSNNTFELIVKSDVISLNYSGEYVAVDNTTLRAPDFPAINDDRSLFAGQNYTLPAEYNGTFRCQAQQACDTSVCKQNLTWALTAAQKAGFRKGGLQLFTQKPHGFKHELVANTDGISKYYKNCAYFVQEHQAEYERLKEKERLQEQLAELERKKKSGMQ